MGRVSAAGRSAHQTPQRGLVAEGAVATGEDALRQTPPEVRVRLQRWRGRGDNAEDRCVWHILHMRGLVAFNSNLPLRILPAGERTGVPAPELGSATRDHRGARAEFAHSPSQIYYRLAHEAP